MKYRPIYSQFLSNPIVKEIFSDPGRTLNSLMQRWNEPWRFFHTIENHLRPMLKGINDIENTRRRSFLELVAWFHDSVYDPKASDNETKSAEYFESQLRYKTDVSIAISKLILLTADYTNLGNDRSAKFAEFDLVSLRNVSMLQMIQNERLLLKEFQFADYSVYKRRRIEFLQNIKKVTLVRKLNIKIIDTICEYLESTRPKIAIYPGSFNPFHTGHLSVLKEAEKLFDKVIVAVGVNPQKEHPIRQVLDNLKNVLPYHQTELFEGFLHKYAEYKLKEADITIIRGFRSGYDIDAELINLAFMRDMSEDLKVIFIAPQKSFDHVSSSAIKQIQTFDKSECGKYLPEVHYPST